MTSFTWLDYALIGIMAVLLFMIWATSIMLTRNICANVQDEDSKKVKPHDGSDCVHMMRSGMDSVCGLDYRNTCPCEHFEKKGEKTDGIGR